MTNDAQGTGDTIRAMIAVIEKGDVNGIRAALDFMDECREYVANGGVTYGKYGLARELFSKNHEQWLRTLLARVDALETENRKLCSVAHNAARLTEQLKAQRVLPPVLADMLTDTVNALAAYEAALSEGAGE